MSLKLTKTKLLIHIGYDDVVMEKKIVLDIVLFVSFRYYYIISNYYDDMMIYIYKTLYLK
jgi:hypothetical protein